MPANTTAATVSREVVKPEPSEADPDGTTDVATGATERVSIDEDE
jgi:hypothetical protein